MKYLSILLLLVVMRWTWSLATTDRAFSLENHRNLETEVERIITDDIHERQPDARDIEFSQLYTEVVQPEKTIKVHFRYAFNAPSSDGQVTHQTFTGDLLLNSDDSGTTWKKTHISLHQPLLRFKNATKVAPGNAPAETLIDQTENPGE
jgi:hypothetical protein